MPEGLLPRFITSTQTMSEPDERWRTGRDAALGRFVARW